MPTPLPIRDRLVRVGFLGLGQIFALNSLGYRDNPNAEVVALCDLDPQRVAQRVAEWPEATPYRDVEQFLRHDLDLVEVLVPTPHHAAVTTAVLEAGHHVALQKPFARSLAEADAMLVAAERSGATLRIMEDQLFFPPLERLKEVVDSGVLGEISGVHFTMKATGLGGWDVSPSAWLWQFEQAKDGMGMLAFDDGWHKFAIAHWLFGPVRRVMAWVGERDLGGGVVIDAPTTVMWDHANGVRGVLDITFAPQTYLKSDFYTCDERVEVTGWQGFARVNRVSARGIDQPALEVYLDGKMTGHHDLPDSLADGFRASTAHQIAWLRGESERPLLLDGPTAREVLRFVLAVFESSRRDAPVTLD